MHPAIIKIPTITLAVNQNSYTLSYSFNSYFIPLFLTARDGMKYLDDPYPQSQRGSPLTTSSDCREKGVGGGGGSHITPVEAGKEGSPTNSGTEFGNLKVFKLLKWYQQPSVKGVPFLCP